MEETRLYKIYKAEICFTEVIKSALNRLENKNLINFLSEISRNLDCTHEIETAYPHFTISNSDILLTKSEVIFASIFCEQSLNYVIYNSLSNLLISYTDLFDTLLSNDLLSKKLMKRYKEVKHHLQYLEILISSNACAYG